MTCAHIINDPDGLLIVGEAPGRNEENDGIPLTGHSGHLLLRTLVDTGIVPRLFLREYEESDKGLGHFCREKHPAVRHLSLANVVNHRPHDNRIEQFFRNKTQGKKEGLPLKGGWHVTQPVLDGLEQLDLTIAKCRPLLILALGSTALWATTGLQGSGNAKSPSGIARWRGSQLYTDNNIPVLPTYHPAFILRVFSLRVVLQHDLNRAARLWTQDASQWWRTERTHHIAPTFQDALQWLDIIEAHALEGKTLTVDIETSHKSWITNVGFGLSESISYTIPFTDTAGRYFSPEEEAQIKMRMRSILQDPRSVIVMQNGEYDRTYLLSELLVRSNLTRDTRTIHHTHYPSLPASLDFMASLYCDDYIYWKDESGEAAEDGDDEKGWNYNGKDCCATWEIDAALQKQTKKMEMQEQVDFEMNLHKRIYPVMNRGVRVSTKRLEALSNKNIEDQLRLAGELEEMVGTHVDASPKASPWHSSPRQQMSLFYDWFGLEPIAHRKTKRPTIDDDALPLIFNREPLTRPLVRRLLSLRQLRSMQANVLKRKLRGDRWVTQYTVPGTNTLRFSSSKDGQDFGLNLQNLTSGHDARPFESLPTPNVRTLILPDSGNVIADVDLDRADLQVVVWEADDEELKKVLRSGEDVHAVNARTIGCTRAAAKAGVHATNYYCKAPTLARVLECSIAEAQNFQNRWFTAHPNILKWQEAVLRSITMTGKVTNVFGFHCHFWGRPQDEVANALAWIPQSTIAQVINRAWCQVEDDPILSLHTRISMQVHDSLVLQWRRQSDPFVRPLLRDAMAVHIPYTDPLVISTGLKISLDSWGQCVEVPWEDERPDPERFQ